MLLLTLSHGAPALASESSRLVSLINEYRQTPQDCEGAEKQAVGPLAPDSVLATVQPSKSKPLQQLLREAGYQAAQAHALSVSGLATARGAMNFISKRYCGMLLDQRFTAIGVSHTGSDWSVILARPLLSDELRNWQEVGRKVLKLVNDARARSRMCGDKQYPAAPPLGWNARLADAALTHSRDMGRQNYFSHTAQNGSTVGDRASAAHYRWRRIGENIAAGQGSPEQVMSGWLASPGHCANIMNRDFTEMGAAYAVNPDSDTVIYWAQVFGTPR